MSLDIVPVSLAEANAFVSQYHRHHKPVVGHKFSIKGTTGWNTKCHCPNCHSMVSHGKYCSNCGQALEWGDSE